MRGRQTTTENAKRGHEFRLKAVDLARSKEELALVTGRGIWGLLKLKQLSWENKTGVLRLVVIPKGQSDTLL